MRKQEFVNDVLVIGLVLMLACSTVQAAGLGVSPQSFILSDALRGGEYESTIMVYNTADDDGNYELNATGPGSEWITFYRVEDPEKPITTIDIKGQYLFNWSDVPGNDSEMLLKFLWDDLNIGWAGNAEIAKSEDGNTISIFNYGNSAELKLDAPNATLTTSDGGSFDLKVKAENGTLRIYRWESEKQRILLKIQIADDAPNNIYNSTICIKSIPQETTAGGGAVAQPVVQMKVTATIMVTGIQILNGTVKSITTADTEIGYPLKIKVLFQNDGNVVAKPTIACCIAKSTGCRYITNNSLIVDTFVYAETGIKPGKTDTITVLWNTTVKEPGDYTVSVNVSLGEGTLATKDLPFKILPSGTLTRAGELKLLYIEGDPLVNHVIKVIASFENTGMIDTMAKFKGEIYCNGEFVDVLEGEEKLIAVGETANLISYYKMTMPGDYLIKGTVIYEGKETEAKEASFAVPEPRAGELKSLSIEGKPGVNRVIKVIACFENTGTVDTKAMFTGEVYCDGEFVDVLEGEEKLIAVGETANLISYYKMSMPGDYLINGTVIYEGKETEAKELSFTVPD